MTFTCLPSTISLRRDLLRLRTKRTISSAETSKTIKVMTTTRIVRVCLHSESRVQRLEKSTGSIIAAEIWVEKVGERGLKEVRDFGIVSIMELRSDY